MPLIRVYDAAGNVTETYEHNGDFKRCRVFHSITLHFPVKGISRDSASIESSQDRFSEVQ